MNNSKVSVIPTEINFYHRKVNHVQIINNNIIKYNIKKDHY